MAGVNHNESAVKTYRVPHGIGPSATGSGKVETKTRGGILMLSARVVSTRVVSTRTVSGRGTTGGRSVSWALRAPATKRRTTTTPPPRRGVELNRWLASAETR